MSARRVARARTCLLVAGAALAAAAAAGCKRWYKPPPVARVAVASRGGVASLEDGRAFVWGAQHEAGFTGEPRVPARAPALDGATALGAGATEACGVVGGAVRCVGAGDDPMPELEGIEDVVVGEGFRCAHGHGAVVCTGIATAWPTLVPHHVAKIAAAGVRLCFLAGEPRVLACVRAGRLEAPAIAEGLGPIRDLEISPGTSCVLDDEGTVACRSAEGPLVRVPQLSGVESFALGAKHGVARLRDGRAIVWGSGPASDVAGYPGDFRVIPGLFGVKSVSAAQDVSCAVLGDATVRCWGLAPPGALPVRVPGRLAVPTEVDWSRTDLSTSVPRP